MKWSQLKKILKKIDERLDSLEEGLKELKGNSKSNKKVQTPQIRVKKGEDEVQNDSSSGDTNDEQREKKNIGHKSANQDNQPTAGKDNKNGK